MTRVVVAALLLAACAPEAARVDGGPRDAAPPDAGPVPSCEAPCPDGWRAVCAYTGRPVSWRYEVGAGGVCLPVSVTDLACSSDAGAPCSPDREARCVETPAPPDCGG